LQGAVVLLGMYCHCNFGDGKELIKSLHSASFPRRDWVHSRRRKSVSSSSFRFHTESSGHILSRHPSSTYRRFESSSKQLSHAHLLSPGSL
jgi:hypothetical protein